jgi:hypothetical protein
VSLKQEGISNSFVRPRPYSRYSPLQCTRPIGTLHHGRKGPAAIDLDRPFAPDQPETLDGG